MATEIITSFLQLSDSAGSPMSGALVYVYDVGTTTLRNIFSDTALGNAAANPIVCDSVGRHDMRYTATGSYKIVVKTSAGVSVYTRDNIDGRVPIGSGALAIANGGTGATSAPAALSNLGAATSAEVAVIAAQLATLAGTLTSVEKTHIATGTTAQRPVAPAEGDIRRNTSTSLYEGYGSAAWENFATYTKANTFPTIQRFTSGTGATYTTPSGVKYIRIRMVGGGGGGGAVVTNDGANGTTSSFESWTAVLGSGGGSGSASGGGNGGTGGAAGTGTLVTRVSGQAGTVGSVTVSSPGGNGGSSYFGGGGASQTNNAAGIAAQANSGGGGSGGCNTGSAAGSGGGAGEYVEFLINTPAATYTYTVGAGGNGGAAGTKAGGNGAAGQIIVEEYYV